MAVDQNPQPYGICQPVQFYNQGKNIAATGNLLCKTGAGTLIGVTVNTPAASAVLKIYDGIDNTGTLLATISCSAANEPATLWYGIGCKVGVFAVLSGGNADVTVLFN